MKITPLFEKLKNADAFIEKNSTISVSFENNKLKTINELFKQGIGLRAIHNNKIGFSSSTNLNSKNLINNALETSKLGEKCFFTLPQKTPQRIPLCYYSKKTEKLTQDEMVNWGEEVIEKLYKIDKNIKINVNIEKTIYQKNLINTNGLNLNDKKTVCEFLVSISKIEENNFLEIYDYKISSQPPDKKTTEQLLESIKFLYNNSLSIYNIKNNYYKVLFTPKAFSSLLHLFITSFDGKLIEKKISYFYDKIGKQFINRNIDIIDNPFIKKSPYSAYFDGDGCKCQKIYLIKNGIIKNFVLDLQTAGKLNKKTNGHSKRNYNSLPAPNFYNIEFNINDKNLLKNNYKNILKELDQGIIVDQLLGMGQSNILGGEFSANIDLGFYVKNGEIKGRIKNSMIAGNFFEFFNNIIYATSEKLQYQNYYIPWVIIDKISVST